MGTGGHALRVVVFMVVSGGGVVVLFWDGRRRLGEVRERLRATQVVASDKRGRIRGIIVDD